MAFKRQEREAAASIMAGDRYCPDPELHELVARAASQERPQPGQWGRDAAEWHRYLHQEGMLVEDEGEDCGPWHHRVFLGKSAPASQERPSIDVERLATAIWFDGIHKGKPFSVEASRWYAESLAAEYARLSGPVGE